MSDAKRYEDRHLADFGELDIEPRFECPICLQCLQDPILTTCGHRFCRECIYQWLQKKGSCCPVDNRPLSISTDLFPDNFTRREIKDLERSSNNTPEHTNQLPLIGSSGLRAEHAGIAASSKSADVILRPDTLTQQQGIQNNLSGISVEATNLWDPDPKTKTAQTDMQGLLRSLYERIVLLEQHNREQAIQIDHLKLQIASNRNGVKKLTEDLQTVHCNGTYIWTISNFSAKMRAQLWTPGFFTSPNGYRFCARLNLAQHDKSCLALHVHLMKSDHDSCLEWPFVGRINFTLVNQNPALNKDDLMPTNPTLLAFRRPTSEIHSRGFGYSEYITLQELERGYSNDDCLTIKIKIVPLPAATSQ